jgi:thioredoxin 1
MKNQTASKTGVVLYITGLVLFLVLLGVFRDKLNSYASKQIKTTTDSSTIQLVEAKIDSAYNYSKNNQPYQITFLEFGAQGCSACKNMELVMDKVRQHHPTSVNVVFINLLLPENRKYMNYFGIATIPTQILLNTNGKEYYRHSGYISFEKLNIHLTSK